MYLVFPQNTENFSTSGGAVSFQEGLFYMVLVSYSSNLSLYLLHG